MAELRYFDAIVQFSTFHHALLFGALHGGILRLIFFVGHHIQPYDSFPSSAFAS